MKISAEFVTSAAGASGFPADRLPEVALVGRSNVGKSSLINALVRQRIARTSAAPGKTRLANIYRVTRGAGAPFHLVDLPGYGYARGGGAAAREFAELARAYFGQDRQERRESQDQREWQGRREGQTRPAAPALPALPALPAQVSARSALLLVDSRHPGLQSDLEAWAWLGTVVADRAIVATKVDKLARGERIRALRELESVFHDSVLPVSAVTGEGLDELWKLIDRLANSRKPQPRGSSPSRPPRAATAPPTRTRAHPKR